MCNTTPVPLSLSYNHALRLIIAFKCTAGHAARAALHCEWWDKDKPRGQVWFTRLVLWYKPFKLINILNFYQTSQARLYMENNIDGTNKLLYCWYPQSWDMHRREVKTIIRNIRKHLDFAVYTNYTDLAEHACQFYWKEEWKEEEKSWLTSDYLVWIQCKSGRECCSVLG